MAIDTVAQFPWAALITAVAGLSGALGGALLTNRFTEKRWAEQIAHEKGKENVKTLREKGEELHILVSKWSKTVINYQLLQLRVVSGLLTQHQFNESIKGINSEPGVHDRLEALLFLYFPELEVDMKSVRNGLLQCGSAYDDFIKDESTKNAAREKLRTAAKETEAGLENIKKGIRDMLKKLI
jgi:hypothetical protein|nr:MAG TPA: hypothetical protein [Caudoviricetes sp.]